MDCSPPGFFVHGDSQARILEWVAMPSSKGSSRPRDGTHVSCLAGRFFYHWATWEGHQSLWSGVKGQSFLLLLVWKQRKVLPSKQKMEGCEVWHLKRRWCWERLRAGEGDDKGWDGWMASPTQRTWVWVDSGSWPGVLRFMGSQNRTRLSDWTGMFSRFIWTYVAPYLKTAFFLRLNNVPLFVYIKFCLSIFLLSDTWVASRFYGIQLSF